MAGARRRFGPPRKAEHRTGASAAFARAIAAGLPGVEESRDREDATFEVGGEAFLCVEDAGSAIVWPAEEAEERIALSSAGRDDVRARIEHAWRTRAPASLASAWTRKRAAWLRQPAVTHADIRRAVLALPGANEGPIWGQDLGFRVGDEKKSRFARFGPPEGGKVGNLLPPDDADTLVILRCAAKPALLASSADRFFSTPHYGADDEPGGVVVRLCEHRGKEGLAELAALLEDAWREVAGPELVAQRARKRPSIMNTSRRE